MGIGKEGVGLAPGDEGGLSEQAQGGSLSDFSFNISFYVGGAPVLWKHDCSRRGWYWVLIVG